MFALRVEYLMGRVFASDFRDRTEPEWPPHPSRLFSAMVAAYHQTAMSNRAREALLWLEKQQPPSIWAGVEGDVSRVNCFVPTNYVESGASKAIHALPARRTKQPRPFAAQGPEDSCAYFLWPGADPPAGIRTVLQEIVARIGYLGRAASLARVTIAESAPPPNWVPEDSGEHVLRVPAEGRLEELEQAFALNRWAPVGPQRLYRKLSAHESRPEPARAVFADLLVFRRVTGIRLTAEATLTVTTAMRAAVMKLADERGLLTERLHGHGAHPHCAYLCFPFVGREHADGRILGVGLALPRDLGRDERRKILAAAGQLEYVSLQRELGVWRVAPLGTGSAPGTLDPSTWVRPARVWNTVTPIVLDRFPKNGRDDRAVAQIIGTSCERMGLPRPALVEFGPYATLEGVPPVPQFRLVRRPGDRPRWAVHATITFTELVRGPLIIGAGRYFGLGLLRPKPLEAGR